jgi:hypothetical protein
MSHVHGDRIDRSRGAVSTRWWGLGILSLARLTARGLLTSCDRTEGVEARRSAREAGIRHGSEDGEEKSRSGRPNPSAAQVQLCAQNENSAFLLSTSCRSGSIRTAAGVLIAELLRLANRLLRWKRGRP